MAKAIESFKAYVITESYKGPEQLRLAQNLYQKPEIFKKEFDERKASLYDWPESMDGDVAGLSKEENELLNELGLGNSIEIENMEVRNLELEYDMIVDWTAVGIDRIIFIPKRIKLTIEVLGRSDYNKDEITKVIEIIDDNIGDRFEWDVTRQCFPIEPTGVEIHMNDSFDASQFRYEFTIGEWR
jgi:hypothetical protein